MRLIDADKLKGEWETPDATGGEYTAFHFLESIDKQPTVDKKRRTKLKNCPFRVHGERVTSFTVPGEYYYNEIFMPCLGEACASFYKSGFTGEYQCHRDNLILVLGDIDDSEGNDNQAT